MATEYVGIRVTCDDCGEATIDTGHVDRYLVRSTAEHDGWSFEPDQHRCDGMYARCPSCTKLEAAEREKAGKA